MHQRVKVVQRHAHDRPQRRGGLLLLPDVGAAWQVRGVEDLFFGYTSTRVVRTLLLHHLVHTYSRRHHHLDPVLTTALAAPRSCLRSAPDPLPFTSARPADYYLSSSKQRMTMCDMYAKSLKSDKTDSSNQNLLLLSRGVVATR